MRVQLQGMRELERALADLPTATSRNIGRRVLKEAGEPVAQRARSLAPRDEGALIESIDVSPTLNKGARAAHPSRAGSVEMYIGPSGLPQGITQEFGTLHHPPQPFMRPAWSAESESTLDQIGGGLWVEVEKAAARHARKTARAAR